MVQEGSADNFELDIIDTHKLSKSLFQGHNTATIQNSKWNLGSKLRYSLGYYLYVAGIVILNCLWTACYLVDIISVRKLKRLQCPFFACTVKLSKKKRFSAALKLSRQYEFPPPVSLTIILPLFSG